MQNKTVWHLCSNRWNSAITEYALSCTQALKLSGWTSILSPLEGSPGALRAKKSDIAGPSFRFRFSDLPRLRSSARSIRPDLIISYGGPETFLSRFLPDVPHVRFRGQDSDISERLPPLATRWNLNHCAAVLTPAEIVAERFRQVLPRTPVIPVTLGLDAGRFCLRPEISKAERPTLLIVGRLDPIKGHNAFFSIFQRFLKQARGPQPFLELVGQESNISLESLRRNAEALGLKEGRDWAISTERVMDLPARMNRAHLGVVSSLGSEVICRVAEEFLLSGTPILVSGVGSLEECLVEESFGASYRGQGDDAISSILASWLERSEREGLAEREKRAASARRYFSLEAMGAALQKSLGHVT